MLKSLTKSQIIELSRMHSFKPRRRLGQNFLIDKNLINKIVNVISPAQDDVFLEIGAGFGALTIPVAQRADEIVAFEVDRKLCDILKEETRELKNVRIACLDFLKIDFNEFFGSKKIRVVGNLPYCIASLIIEKLTHVGSGVRDIYIMTQKEFADRLTATPRSGKEYSSLTLFANFYFSIRKLFAIKRTCFWPRPKVDSVFLKLKERLSHPVKVRDEKLMFDVIRSAFGKRRKTILNSLASGNFCYLEKEQLRIILKKAGISARDRAENLNLEDFARLANIINQYPKREKSPLII